MYALKKEAVKEGVEASQKKTVSVIKVVKIKATAAVTT